MNDNLINKIIDQELKKPEENIDMELINSCVDYLIKEQKIKINPILLYFNKIKNYIKLKIYIRNSYKLK